MARIMLSPSARVKRIRHDLGRIRDASETTHFARAVIREIEDLLEALNKDLENPNARNAPTR